MSQSPPPDRSATAPRPQADRSPPPGAWTRVGGFVGELKRRHVFRIGAVYAAVAFIVFQAADLILRGLNLPEWTFSLVVVLTILGAPIALVLAWAYDLTPDGVRRTSAVRDAETGTAAGAAAATLTPPAERSAAAGTARERPARHARPAARHSLAVLPFTNLSERPEDEYISDGITEELIASLARLRGLRVVSRTSVMRYKRGDRSVREIAEELGVDTVLEGSVRRYGQQIRVVAQLIDAEADEHLWGDTYDGTVEDTCEIQCDLARRITEALQIRLSAHEMRHLDEPPTADAEAYDLYLRGRFLWNSRTETGLRQAVAYLERALEADPGFALAAAGLADAYLTLGLYGLGAPDVVMTRARDAADRALELDASLAAATAARACVRALYDRDWAGAEQEFRRAIAADPQYALAPQWLATHLLAPLGRFDEARAALESAAQIEPFSIAVRMSRAVLLYFERRFGESADEYRQLLASHPEFGPGHYFLGQVLAVCGEHDEAEATLRQAVRLTDRSAESLSTLAYLLGRVGRAAEAREILDELQSYAAQHYVSPTLLAQAHLGLGDPGAALGLLRDAQQARAVDLVWLKVRPIFDPLRGDPEYHQLVRELGLA